MDEEALIDELASLRSQADPQATARAQEVRAEILQAAEAHRRTNQHWRAVSLLGRARHAIAPRRDLDRPLALVLGGKAELLLQWADALRVRPSEPLLAELESDLHEAVSVNPTLPDPHWDLAVVAARFRGDYDAAADHLADAQNLDYQPPAIAALETLLAARPPVPQGPDTPDQRLRRLLLELAEQARGPMAGLLTDDGQPFGEGRPEHVRTFDQYFETARALAQEPQLSVDDLLAILDDSEAITSDSSEYVADLLRRLAEARAGRDAGDTRFLDLATQRHLQILRAVVFEHAEKGRASGDKRLMRRSLRAARRALAIVAASPTTVDPDLHADLLLGEGAALWSLDERNVRETITCYREALRLKRQAGNDADVARLTELFWTQIDHRVGRALASLHAAGFGQALEVLEACAEAADELDDADHALGVRFHLGEVQRVVSQYEESEANLQRVIRECSNPETVNAAKFELASVYSETNRPAEAAILQEELLKGSPDEVGRVTATLWSNYANSLRLLGRLPEARDAVEKAWALLPANQKEKRGDVLPELGARIKLMTAQIDQLLGDGEGALERLAEAEALYPDPKLGMQGLHFHGTRAEVLLALGRTTEALESLEQADDLRRFLLGTGPSYTTWESMLRRWSRLDVSAVRALVAAGDPAAHQKALLQAEAAKGRVTAWLENAIAPKGAEYALDPKRQERALERARRWLTDGPRRRIVSLFASDEGLAVFDLGPHAEVAATWIDNFNYDLFRRERYDPWEQSVEAAMESDDRRLAEQASTKTGDLLDQVGAWLSHGAPSLADGGEQLVIIPHRLFRGLPLLHARLPSGARPSDLFASVVAAPTLAHLVPEHDHETAGTWPIPRWALADADLTLPFARCEALLGVLAERCLLGHAATRAAVADAFRQPALILLSMHGDFDPTQPWRSQIFASDGPVELGDLAVGGRIDAHAVVLGVCEAGRSRRSISDEPWGFPTLLLQQGAETVVAPSWQVDDFASFLLITFLFAALDEDTRLERALVQAALWLRELRAEQIGPHIDLLMERLRAAGKAGQAAAGLVAERVEAQRAWLEGLDPLHRPFDSPLDWAAFQVFGSAPMA